MLPTGWRAREDGGVTEGGQLASSGFMLCTLQHEDATERRKKHLKEDEVKSLLQLV